MKVNELIKLLQEQDQEADVILSNDGEGNSYRFLDHNFGYAPYYKDGFDLEPVEPEDEIEKDNLPKAVFLYPNY